MKTNARTFSILGAVFCFLYSLENIFGYLLLLNGIDFQTIFFWLQDGDYSILVDLTVPIIFVLFGILLLADQSNKLLIIPSVFYALCLIAYTIRSITGGYFSGDVIEYLLFPLAAVFLILTALLPLIIRSEASSSLAYVAFLPSILLFVQFIVSLFGDYSWFKTLFRILFYDPEYFFATHLYIIFFESLLPVVALLFIGLTIVSTIRSKVSAPQTQNFVPAPAYTPSPLNENALFCPACGAKLKPNAHFCPQCGMKL